MFYNIADGGFGSNPMAGKTEEQMVIIKQKWPKASSGKNNYFYGKHFCGKDHPLYGKHHSEESKRKMSEAKKGEKAPKAVGADIYDKDENFVKHFGTIKELKIFLGVCPTSSSEIINRYVREHRLYHGYYIKRLK